MTKQRAILAAVAAALLLPATAWAGAADRVAKQAEAFYAKRDQAGMIDKAIEAYQQVLAIDDMRVDTYWKLARAYYWKGTHTSDSDEAMEVFREGIEFAKLAVELDPASAGAHFWLAVCYGKFGEAKGIMQSLHLVDPMREELEKVLAIDERFEWGGAHRVLCRFYMKVPGFKGGDIDKAIEHGRKGIAIGPRHTLNYLFLAEALIEDGQDAEAKKVLQQLIDLEPLPERLPEAREDKAAAKELLADLG